MELNETTVRGSGRTTRQMRAAPLGAVFVWCNSHIEYATKLSKTCGRTDLQIVSPSWLLNQSWQGLELKGLVIDHAMPWDKALLEAYDRAVTRVRLRKTDNVP